MKLHRTTTIIIGILLCCALPLSGCASLYANYREVEQLRIMQALGLDRAPGGVIVTLAAAADPSGSAPLCFSGTGESVSAAIESVRGRAAEEDLFTGHLKHILIGEAAARQGLEPYLSYICRSPDVRLDMPLFILRGGTAREAMSTAGTEERGIAEVLQAAQTSLDTQSGGNVFTAAEILRSLWRDGSALICALEYGPASETSDSGAGGPSSGEAGAADTADSEPSDAGGSGEAPVMTAAAGGFAVIKDGKLCEFIDRDAALGAGFLTNTVGIRELVVRDRFGAPVTLEIQQGGTRLHPLWNPDGSLRGIEIYANVSAALLEAGSGTLTAAESTDYLTGQLEAAVSDRIGAVLWLAKTLEADFLGLGERVEQASPLKYRRMGQSLGPLLPSLELSIAVQGELSHSHDLD